jgi:hypothetical protein
MARLVVIFAFPVDMPLNAMATSTTTLGTQSA